MRIITIASLVTLVGLKISSALATTVSGVVVTTVRGQDAPIPFIAIRVCQVNAPNQCYNTSSRSNGEFLLPNVPPAQYKFEGKLSTGAVFSSEITVTETGVNYFRIHTPP
jgi:hypothetical protein